MWSHWLKKKKKNLIFFVIYVNIIIYVAFFGIFKFLAFLCFNTIFMLLLHIL